MLKVPCEIIVWKVLPAIRSQAVTMLIKQGVSRKKAAELFDISEAAVSQYLSSERGSEFEFDERTLQAIEKFVREIKDSEDSRSVLAGMCKICSDIKLQMKVCKAHKAESDALATCNLCQNL